MGPVGVPEILIVLAIGILLASIVLALLLVTNVIRRRTRRMGFTSVAAYLRATPRSDAERRDAVDLALVGLVICILGMVFAPVVLAGLVPLFYGGRKLVYSSMGLGLVDDGEQPGA